MLLERLGNRSTLAVPLMAVLVCWRVAHGVSGAILCLYVLFHLANHLTGLVGPELHAQVMDLGRTLYRAGFIEPLLVLAFVFQVVSGLDLAWRWSARVLLDPWNIRLVPHYALGVFLVLLHLLLGLRMVMQAHGLQARAVRLIWRSGVIACAAIALAIIAGMCGVRL